MSSFVPRLGEAVTYHIPSQSHRTNVGTRALEVNLRRTAVEVVIPARDRLLLDITAPMHGIHNGTDQLLREFHHTYIGWTETLPDLHRRAMGDLYHYNQHPQGAEALTIFCDMYAKAASEATPSPLHLDALRKWLLFLEKIASESGDQLDRNLEPVAGSIGSIRRLIERSPGHASAASSGIRRLASLLHDRLEHHEASEQALDLLAVDLEVVYQSWLDHDDPVNWVDLDGVPIPEPMVAISRTRLATLRSRIIDIRATGGGRDGAAELLAMPDHQRLCRAHVEAADAVYEASGGDWRGLMNRAVWLCRVLGHELLAPVHESALYRIGWDCRGVVSGATDGQLDGYLSRVFESIADGAVSGRARLDLVREIGEAVLRSGDATRAVLLVDRVLEMDFEYPEFGGFTDEWGVVVNPSHLTNVRTFFRLIAADPRSSHRLLEALIVHLKVGGVFMADTDLFQRDVSRLLAADIKPVFQQTKALLRLLPVYYNDIGAEGEMRTVSTRLDEMRGRRDPLIHFLRKQSHVESNPHLVTFIEEIAAFWATGDKRGLRSFIPADLYEQLDIEDDNYRVLHEIFSEAMPTRRAVHALFSLTADEAMARVEAVPCDRAMDKEKAALLVQLRYEVARKYELSHADIIDRLREFNRIPLRDIAALQEALSLGSDERAVEMLIEMLEQLQARILDPEPTEAEEDIYHKRHIAVGIPSMYGRYKEERLEAVGMMFRIESLTAALFDRRFTDTDLDRVDRKMLGSVATWLRLLVRALRTDGIPTTSLEMSCSMLGDALGQPGTTRQQFVNVFQRLSRNVQNLVRHRYLEVYGSMVEQLGQRMIQSGVISVDPRTSVDEMLLRASEAFLRDFIADSLSLPRVDSLVARVLHGLSMGSERIAEDSVSAEPTADINDWFVHIRGTDAAAAGLVRLGNKGFMLNRLAQHGLPIPSGFIITSDLGRDQRMGALSDTVVQRIGKEVGRLEDLAGARFGDPDRPMLLSVRGGAPISMPGMLDSFLNVGINAEIAEGIAGSLKRPWAAWDSYRRFLQFWGMSHGINRDLFDQLILEAKQQQSVPKKSLLPADRMKDLASEYRQLVVDHGIDVVDDPFTQLLRCVDLVLASWRSPMAQVYRDEMQIADEWGTGVIVQRMVFGNLHDRSGTGVVQTRHPDGDLRSFELYGDFIIHGQGDDVVSGLVETFPITERQRMAELDDRGRSLEQDFPDIFGELRETAATLIDEHGLPHQEIEFTFQGDQVGQLFILQSRDAVDFQRLDVGAFVPSESLELARVARGIGVGGGAFSGRVARTAADIDRIRGAHPDEQVLLVRPDTVPDDIGLLIQADGLLTGIGGATSHAAVVAKRLGKPCVVGCRQLSVLDDQPIRFGERPVADGEYLSISGRDGSIYIGKHPVTIKRMRGL